MTSTGKDKLKHDFLNSIIIINSLTKSAENCLSKLPANSNQSTINQQQMDKFLYSMRAIREQTAMIEKYFQGLLNEYPS